MLAKEKPPIFGMTERGGEVVLKMLAHVQQKTIEPIIRQMIVAETLVYSDEYTIYGGFQQGGYAHKTVNHSQGDYARDEDGDGFHEVHVNTIEGLWWLWWLRRHRGVSQEQLGLYLGFFEFVHNAGKRGQALLPSLVGLLLATPWNPY